MDLGLFTLKLRQSEPLTLDDLRRRGRRRLPAPVRAYVDNGSDDERTRDENVGAWRNWRVKQRVLAGVETVDTTTMVAGHKLALPMLLSPVGLAGAMHGRGDIAAARAAGRHGTRLIVSTGSTHTLEEIAEDVSDHHWFQLYPWGDRQLTGSLIERAARSGYGVLFVTVDVPIVGNRVGERRHGMGTEPTLTPARALEYGRHVRWLANMARHRRIGLANLVEQGDSGDVRSSVRRQRIAMRPDLTWDDVKWMRDQWSGPFYIKGVLDADDARRAVEIGADGIVVSNHGGRQLNATLPTAVALPRIADAVGSDLQVLVDGGIRSGHDVAVAVALGADAVLLGRPWAWSLSAAGEKGVDQLLTILGDELRRTMHLMGVSSLAGLTRDTLEFARV